MEDVYIIKGGKKLLGEVKLSGAKNAALKMIIASLLFENKVVLNNVPHIRDIEELLNLINQLGVKTNFIKKNLLEIDPQTIRLNKVDMLYSSKIRVSFMLFAPLLYKFGECYIPNPGGCRIGARPIDRIIDGMKSLGIEVNYDEQTGYYIAKMTKKPSGYYRFLKPTHTGTELLIMLSVFSEDKVILDNASSEPEIDNLIEFLNLAGGKITRLPNNKIEIIGVKKLIFNNKPFEIILDRNEAVTFVCLSLATKGNIILKDIDEKNLSIFIEKIKLSGANFYIKNKDLHFEFINQLKAVSIETLPHPGFMTDWQPTWSVLMTQAKGRSMIHERVFENRFSYVEELNKLGAKIKFINKKVKNPKDFYFFNYEEDKDYQQIIEINGPVKLHNGVLNIKDLRAGATLAIAALVAQGESIVNNVSILERGYEDFVDKVKNLGANIKKI